MEDFERARAARSQWERLASLRRSGAYHHWCAAVGTIYAGRFFALAGE